jgi:hypothetical protein
MTTQKSMRIQKGASLSAATQDRKKSLTATVVASLLGVAYLAYLAERLLIVGAI